MKVNNKYTKPLIMIIALLIVALTTVASYAYFTATINGSARNNVITTGYMEVTYIDGPEVTTLENMLPGQSVTKTFSVKNTGTVEAYYDIYMNDVENTFNDKSDLVFEITSEDGGTNIYETECPSEDGIIANTLPIGVGQTHHYTLTITFKETNDDQDDNKGVSFTGVLSLKRKEVFADILGEEEPGAKVKIGSEEFYIISEDETSITMLAKYGIEVGNIINYNYTTDPNTGDTISNHIVTPIEKPSGKQSAGVGGDSNMIYGGLAFTDSIYWADNCVDENSDCELKSEYGSEYPVSIYDINSNVKSHVDKYAQYISSLGFNATGRLLRTSDLDSLGIDYTNNPDYSEYNWLISMDYALDSVTKGNVLTMQKNQGLVQTFATDPVTIIRPVITINKERISHSSEEGVFAYLYYEQNAVSYAEQDLYGIYSTTTGGYMTQAECEQTLQEAITSGPCTAETCSCTYAFTANSDSYILKNTFGTYDTLESCSADMHPGDTCIEKDGVYHIQYDNGTYESKESCEQNANDCGPGGCTCKLKYSAGTDIYTPTQLQLSPNTAYYGSMNECQNSEEYLQGENSICDKVVSKGEKYIEVGLQDKYVSTGDMVDYGYIPINGKTLVLRRTKNGDETQCTKNGDYYDCSGATSDSEGRTLLEYYGNIENIDMCGLDDEDCTTNTLWNGSSDQIKRIAIEEKIYPTNTSDWFKNINLKYSLDLNKKIDTTNVTDMSRMFKNYSHDNTRINLGDSFNTKNVKNMKSMFEGAFENGTYDVIAEKTSNNTNYTLNLGPNFDTSKVTDMSYMFKGFEERAGTYGDNINISIGDKFNTFNVHNMEEMFAYINRSWGSHNGADTCSGTFTMTLPDSFDTSNVTNMAGMFQDFSACSKNTTLNLGANFDVSKVTDMTYMFHQLGQNASFTSLDLGPKFKPTIEGDDSIFFAMAGYSSSYDFTYSPDYLQIYAPASTVNWIIDNSHTNTQGGKHMNTDVVIAKYE